MKRRSLALFLALLMAFGSILPVFATEPAVEAAAEEQAPTLSYEDLYVEDGLVFAWDAFDKTAEDAVDFGEGSSLILGTYGDKSLVLTKPSAKGTAVYGDGYLEVTDYNSTAALTIANAYDVVPVAGAETLLSATYTTQMTMALLANDGTFAETHSAVGRQYAIPFSSFNTYKVIQTFGTSEALNIIDEEGMALYNAWSRAYLAAKNDASLQASFRTPISKAHYDALAEDATYGEHVFVVNGTDEDTTNDPIGAYSLTGYEADYTAFAYMMKTAPYNNGYYDPINYNPDTKSNIFAGGIAKNTLNTVTWAADTDWKGNSGNLLTYKQTGEVATQTRITTVTANETNYTASVTAYADLNRAINNKTVSGTTAPTAKFAVEAGFDARYYSFHIYSRALEESEMKQNHFADLCGYYGVDLTKVAAIMTEEDNIAVPVLSALYDASMALSIGETTADAVSALIDDAEASVVEAKKNVAYGQMYVQDGLMYRWDAYDLDGIDGTTLTMGDKDGRGIDLSLSGVSYNSTYKVPETTNPYNFSALVKRTDGVYDEDNLEFELVMTQTSFNGTWSTYNRPYMELGPISSSGSGALLTEGTHDFDSYGGYAAFYIGNRMNGNFETVTYYFDAEGNKVDAAVDGGTSVDVQYHNSAAGKSVQICTQTWAKWQRYVGAPVGQSYSIGGQMTFTLGAENVGTMTMAYYRDGLHSKTFSNISYVPGAGSTYDASTRIVPTTLAEAEAMAARHASLNHNFPAAGGTFRVGGVVSGNLKVGYHAFRLYNRHLTDAERQQNHFADLCNYYKVDNILAYNALTEEHKAAIYTQAQFNTAVINSYTEATNSSFEDVTKEQLEAAIDEYVAIEEQEKANAEHVAKYEKLAEMYVSGATAFWSAFGAKQVGDSTIGVVTDGAALVESHGETGSAAYGDGYFRLINANLKIDGAYAAPAAGESVNYTTEMIYATVDGNRTRSYTGGAKFTTQYGVIFGQKVSGTFKTFAVSEDITYTDAAGKAMQEAWGAAYLAASKDETLKAAFWTPISEADYNSMIAITEQAGNVRKVGGDSGNTAVGAYSLTGYEANWAGFQYVIAKNGLNRGNYYHGYAYAESAKPGIGNSYIMKSDINLGGSWAANYDFDNWGEKGNFSRHDFGVVTSHTWIDGSTNTAGAYATTLSEYGDNTLVTTRSNAKSTFSTSFQSNAFDADYYAIRIYPFALSDTERAQNHFADLANYYGIDNADAFFALTDASKESLYTAFASTMIKDTDKASIESAITAASAREEYVSTLAAETYVEFKGYQVRMYDYAGLRSVYEVHKGGEIENVTLVEVGAIMAIANDRTVADLTVEKTADGYVATGAQMESTAVYKDEAWTGLYEKDGVSTFGYTCTFEGITDKTKLTTDLLFRGYAVIEYEGVEFVIYTDMTSDNFGETISMYEASKYASFADYDTSKAVIAAVDGTAE